MNGRSKMQGRKNWILLILSLAGNLEKPLMSLYETEWRDRGYGRKLYISLELLQIFCSIRSLHTCLIIVKLQCQLSYVRKTQSIAKIILLNVMQSQMNTH
jgi:hypothetical protein